MKVGIAGSFSAINRHICVLEKLDGISVAGRWALNGKPDEVINLESGKKNDPEQIIDETEALIITDGGTFYNQLAIMALRRARHVFLYPSVVRSLAEVYQLIKTAREANVILKSGRTGKYGINGLIRNITDLKDISMIEFQHVLKIEAGIPVKIYEIILEDAEILSRLIHARNTSVRAKGMCMFSSQPEVINARLEFDNGIAVNYYCNLVGTDNEHNITIMLKDSMLMYSLISNELSGWYSKRDINKNDNPVFIRNIQLEQTDYLFDDLSAFFSYIRTGPAFLSIYDNGFESVVLTDRILEKVSKTLVQIA